MEKDNNKKNKISSNQRFLSPSFKKGAVKENKDEEFKINLIMDGMNENEETMSPNVKKSKKSKRLSLHEGNVLQQSSGKKRASNELEVETIDKITEQAKKLNIVESHIKNLAYMSQAGKGEDGFTKVNQDSYLVIQNLYKLGDFNIFGVLDGHGMNGNLVSQIVMKYINS